MKNLILAFVLLVAWSTTGQSQDIIRSGKLDNTRDSTVWRIIGPGASFTGGDPDTSETLTTDGWSEFSVQFAMDDNDTTACCDSIDYRLVCQWSNDQSAWFPLDSTMLVSDSTSRAYVFGVRPFTYLRIIGRGYRGHGYARAWSQGAVYLTAKGRKGGIF